MFGFPFMSFLSSVLYSFAIFCLFNSILPFLNHFLCTVLISFTIPGFQGDFLLFIVPSAWFNIFFKITRFPQPLLHFCYLLIPDSSQWEFFGSLSRFFPLLLIICISSLSAGCTNDLTLLPGPLLPRRNSSTICSLNLRWY